MFDLYILHSSSSWLARVYDVLLREQGEDGVTQFCMLWRAPNTACA
jgi:hypothetical protein